MTTGMALQGADQGLAPAAEALIERARLMIPVLKERFSFTVAGRGTSEQTIVELREAGFFRVLQSKCWGGCGMRPNIFRHSEAARRRVDGRDILVELGGHRMVGGREDISADVALDMVRQHEVAP